MLDQSKQFSLPFISAQSDPECPPPVFCLDDNDLKSSRRLHHPFFADMHPLDVTDIDRPFIESVVKCDLCIGHDQFPVADPVQQQCSERQEDEEHDDEDNRVVKDKGETVFDECPFDPDVQQQRQQIDQRLLIVKIEFVFEFVMHEPFSHPI